MIVLGSQAPGTGKLECVSERVFPSVLCYFIIHSLIGGRAGASEKCERRCKQG